LKITRFSLLSGLALTAAFSTALAVPASAQVGIYIGRTPPPLRYEVRPASPGDGYAWQEGYWGTTNGRYVWVGGRWNQAPYPGAVWNHPHYDHYNQGWAMHEGHWDHEDHGGYREQPHR